MHVCNICTYVCTSELRRHIGRIHEIDEVKAVEINK